MSINIEVTLKVITCYKGHIYAVPHWVATMEYKCPMCSKDMIWDAHQKINKLQRVVAGLRGENTKLRNET